MALFCEDCDEPLRFLKKNYFPAFWEAEYECNVCVRLFITSTFKEPNENGIHNTDGFEGPITCTYCNKPLIYLNKTKILDYWKAAYECTTCKKFIGTKTLEEPEESGENEAIFPYGKLTTIN